MGWNDQQVREFCKPLQNEFKRSGQYLTATMREALVDAEALRIVRMQHAESVAVADIDSLVERMRQRCGS